MGVTNSATRFGEISHFGNKNKVFGNSWRVYLVPVKILNLLWLFFAIGQMFIVVNSQIFKKIYCHLVTLVTNDPELPPKDANLSIESWKMYPV